MAKIYPLRTGYIKLSPAAPDRTAKKGPLAYTGLFQKRSNRINLPVKTFYVEVNDHKILVDTGWCKDCIEHPMRYLGLPLWFTGEPLIQDESESVDVQLAEKHGVSPEALDAVIITHMDLDHVSGVTALRSAPHIYVSEEEWKKANSMSPRYYNKKPWKGMTFDLFKMAPDATTPFNKSCDLFGDGSVVVVFTPGHTQGSVSVVIREGDKFAVLAGDNGYTSYNWEELRLPGPSHDDDEYLKSLQWVKKMAHDPNCVGIFASHDPEKNDEVYDV